MARRRGRPVPEKNDPSPDTAGYTPPYPGRRRRERRQRRIVILALVLLVLGVWTGSFLLRRPPQSDVPFPKAFITEGGDLFLLWLRPKETPDYPVRHPRTGEPGWPAFQCNNPRCPGRSGERKYVFPVRIAEGQSLNRVPVYCPLCLQAGFDRDEALLTSRYMPAEGIRAGAAPGNGGEQQRPEHTPSATTAPVPVPGSSDGAP